MDVKNLIKQTNKQNLIKYCLKPIIYATENLLVESITLI